ncbi:MAG: exodeoxyribonuclease III [Candidatus Saccharibacteria bacterium]|nr:exodeoxyribonuclease III [Candidatus Saccharibacteria bacterium]
MKLYSWNVNGLRAVLRKGALQEFMEDEQPDILCVQETKAKRDQVEVDLPDYVEYWNSAERAGYSGTAIFVKNGLEVLNVANDLPERIAKKYNLDEKDAYGAPNSEGRVITLEFKDFYLVNVYTPNSKRELTRLELREKSWDPAFKEYVDSLDKPVIICGDFNAAHTEIDLARPKDNEKNAGYTIQERQGMTNLQQNLVDTFRQLHPEDRRYTWWSHIGHSRERNIGWRIDYFLVSPEIKFSDAEILEEYMGSDHCPIMIEV